MQQLHVLYEIPSANRLKWKPWYIQKKDRDLAQLAVRCAMGKRLPAATTRKRVEIVSYRKRRCADRANLEAGCKSLNDALTSHKLIVDDSDTWCRFIYDQDKASNSPMKRPMTVVTIYEQDEEADLQPQDLPVQAVKP